MASNNRFFDDITRMFGDAAGAASGMRREVETMVKAQIERFLRDMDVATREELAVLRDQVDEVRRENDGLRGRLATLEGAPSPTAADAETLSTSPTSPRRPRGAGRSAAANDATPPEAESPSGNTL